MFQKNAAHSHTPKCASKDKPMLGIGDCATSSTPSTTTRSHPQVSLPSPGRKPRLNLLRIFKASLRNLSGSKPLDSSVHRRLSGCRGISSAISASSRGCLARRLPFKLPRVRGSRSALMVVGRPLSPRSQLPEYGHTQQATHAYYRPAISFTAKATCACLQHH